MKLRIETILENKEYTFHIKTDNKTQRFYVCKGLDCKTWFIYKGEETKNTLEVSTFGEAVEWAKNQ